MIEDLTRTPSTTPASLFYVIFVKTVAMNDDTYLFSFSVKDGCIQHAHAQIKGVAQLQKPCQSACQNHIGSALYVQMGPEREICLLMGEKGAWLDKVTAESRWLAWLCPHLQTPCKKLALKYLFYFLSVSRVCVSGMCSLRVLCPRRDTSCLRGPGPAPGVTLQCSLRGVSRQESCSHPRTSARALKHPQGSQQSSRGYFSL